MRNNLKLLRALLPAQSGYRDPTGASKWQYDSDIKDSHSLSLRAREELGRLATWRHELRRGARLSTSSIPSYKSPISKERPAAHIRGRRRWRRDARLTKNAVVRLDAPAVKWTGKMLLVYVACDNEGNANAHPSTHLEEFSDAL